MHTTLDCAFIYYLVLNLQLLCKLKLNTLDTFPMHCRLVIVIIIVVPLRYITLHIHVPDLYV